MDLDKNKIKIPEPPKQIGYLEIENIKTMLPIYKPFNLFQKFMYWLCFGAKIKMYNK